MHTRYSRKTASVREKNIIALGANQPSRVGPPLFTLQKALFLLEKMGIKVHSRSRWFRTPAWPKGAGPDYINAAALLETSESNVNLLKILHEIEAELGRERDKRWEPRCCDLDLIACGNHVIPDVETVSAAMANAASPEPDSPPASLILPHPRLAARAFVLAPICDIAPEWRHPLTGLTIRDMLAALPQEERDALETIDE